METRKLIISLIIMTIISMSLIIIFITNSLFSPYFLDSDKDGIVDINDIFPNNPNEHKDTDKDGCGDNVDEFPFNQNEWKDTDGDKIGDNSDKFPFNQNEWEDKDNDGVGDNSDVFPENPNEWSDLDNDGIGCNSDINPLVDLNINISLDKFKVNEKVDLLKWCQIYIIININDGEIIQRIDKDGENWNILIGKEQNINFIYNYDIPDNTNKNYTNIEIIMYDYDFFF